MKGVRIDKPKKKKKKVSYKVPRIATRSQQRSAQRIANLDPKELEYVYSELRNVPYLKNPENDELFIRRLEAWPGIPRRRAAVLVTMARAGMRSKKGRVTMSPTIRALPVSDELYMPPKKKRGTKGKKKATRKATTKKVSRASRPRSRKRS